MQTTLYAHASLSRNLERIAHGFILALIGSFLFANKKGVHVHLCSLPLLRDLTQTATYSWGSAILAQLYQELCRAILDSTRDISGCITLLQVSITLFYYIHIHIHNTSLVCLLFVYFLFNFGLMRDFIWGNPILGNQQHIQHLQSLIPYMMTTPMLSMET